MASFKKRGKTWQYSISRMVNAKYMPITKSGFTTKKEAQVAAAEIELEMRKGVVPNLKPVPFSDYFASWLSLYKVDIVGNTLSRYQNSVNTVLNYFGDTPIQQITKRKYQGFLNDYAQSHAKESTRKLNTHIRACVKDAVDEGLIRVDFTRGVTLSGSVPTKKSSDKHLNYSEGEILLRWLYKHKNKSKVQYLILLATTSGLRFSELLGLTRKDFNFVTKTISINKTWGYTNKMHTGWGPTKNEQSNREIKMDHMTMNVFQDLFANEPEHISKLVFYSNASKYGVISNNAVNKELKKLLQELKLSHITIHGLRHTHASILLYKGVSIYYVSERLGHGDIETTLNTYAHIVKELRDKDENATASLFKSMIG
ncbi:tyrosine-type recombinase/integrase [Paenalkalicoccus suaedae]|uniref:Tyrosine-type recombinase/integrase n=1 Tax=Paenalkalicoccus suaedae TaxID=2592382 RepID=A0A859FIC1_9BACI|nr:tyrosine-type recombinase/integrase [Paenalkalicoccus suaedae]QKS71946.1 tyrosine-type recombinase/integrase [Paenalkalicoccus suaedae]